MSTPKDQALRVLIVDDEASARNRLIDLLDDAQAQIPTVLAGEAANGVEALKYFDMPVKPQVVLTDIHMPTMDGMEFARHCLKLERPPAVIFTTAFDQYAVQAFEVNAIDYLVKPVRLPRLLEALQKLEPLDPSKIDALPKAPRRYLSISERGRVTLVPIDDVVYLKAELKYITVMTAQKEYLIEDSLNHLEVEYADRFVRIHRNCLVARDEIQEFERARGAEGEVGWQAVLRSRPERMLVSRRQQHVIKAWKSVGD